MSETTTLDMLVGEGKKFKTVEDLAKGKLESDNFIAQLQTENAGIREELEKALNSADKTSALEKLMSQLKDTVDKSQQTRDPSSANPDNQTDSLSQDDIVKIIEAREAKKQEDRNLAESLDKFAKVYGKDKVDEQLQKLADGLGLTKDDLTAIAKRSPGAFANMTGLNTRDSTTRATPSGRSGERIISGPGTDNGIHGKEYWAGVRKEMGEAKFLARRDLNIQMYKDMQTLGEQWDAN